jgi:hypothetical protein
MIAQKYSVREMSLLLDTGDQRSCTVRGAGALFAERLDGSLSVMPAP